MITSHQADVLFAA